MSINVFVVALQYEFDVIEMFTGVHGLRESVLTISGNVVE
jgi:hypothetical protein